MTKTDFIAFYAEKNGTTKKDAKANVEAMLDTIVAALKTGDDIALPGFGKFTIDTVEARTGRNPSNGEAIEIPAHNKLGFKWASNVKAELR